MAVALADAAVSLDLPAGTVRVGGDDALEILATRDDVDMVVIGTGGVVSLFQGSARTIDHYDSDVTIRGLLLLYERNLSKARSELK